MASSAYEKVRRLTIADLDLHPPAAAIDEVASDNSSEAQAQTEAPLPEDNEVLQAVRSIIGDGYAGAIFSGPPGTGKTHYARRVALTLANGVTTRTEFVQFHPSYQYDDFVLGYTPVATGGFQPDKKVFARLCNLAANDPDGMFVLVIDEFSRTDVARVFGEVLTYIETTKRGMPFRLQSGEEMTVPANLFIIATMNPWDRGVDDLDVALERRFATVDFPPDAEVLKKMLATTQLPGNVQEGVVTFFRALQGMDNDYCRIGHAYFNHLTDEASLQRLWRYQLHPHFRRAARLDRGLLDRLEKQWASMVLAKLPPQPVAEAQPGEAAKRLDSDGAAPTATDVVIETGAPPTET